MERTVLLHLGQSQFFSLLEQHYAVAQKIMGHLASCLRDADEQIKTLSMFDVYGGIIRCLLKLANQRGIREKKGIVIEPRPSNQVIAQMIGVSRETVSRAMKVLQETRFLKIDKASCMLEERALKRYWYLG